MTQTTPRDLLTDLPDLDQDSPAAYGLAAACVLAEKFRRPTLRVTRASLRPEGTLTFSQVARPEVLRANRALMEETLIVDLAGVAARQVKYGTSPTEAERSAVLDRLVALLRHDDEREVADAYLTVLLARARAELRRHWAEVEIVTIGLRERGWLDGPEIEHRIRCAQGIRGATLN